MSANGKDKKAGSRRRNPYSEAPYAVGINFRRALRRPMRVVARRAPPARAILSACWPRESRLRALTAVGSEKPFAR